MDDDTLPVFAHGRVRVGLWRWIPVCAAWMTAVLAILIGSSLEPLRRQRRAPVAQSRDWADLPNAHARVEESNSDAPLVTAATLTFAADGPAPIDPPRESVAFLLASLRTEMGVPRRMYMDPSFAEKGDLLRALRIEPQDRSGHYLYKLETTIRAGGMDALWDLHDAIVSEGDERLRSLFVLLLGTSTAPEARTSLLRILAQAPSDPVAEAAAYALLLGPTSFAENMLTHRVQVWCDYEARYRDDRWYSTNGDQVPASTIEAPVLAALVQCLRSGASPSAQLAILQSLADADGAPELLGSLVLLAPTVSPPIQHEIGRLLLASEEAGAEEIALRLDPSGSPIDTAELRVVRAIRIAFERECDPVRREELLSSLPSSIASGEGEDLLVRAFRDEVPGVRSAALSSVRHACLRPSGHLLRQAEGLLADPVEEVRIAAAEALGARGSREHLSALDRLARERSRLDVGRAKAATDEIRERASR